MQEKQCFQELCFVCGLILWTSKGIKSHNSLNLWGCCMEWLILIGGIALLGIIMGFCEAKEIELDELIMMVALWVLVIPCIVILMVPFYPFIVVGRFIAGKRGKVAFNIFDES